MSEILYVNGYDKFKVVATKGARIFTYNFSFKYEALTEFYKKISVIDEYTDGSKSKIFKHVNYWWDIDYGNYIEKSDLLTWRDIENKEIEGFELTLIPHIDTELLRSFNVILDDDEPREIGLHSHFNTGVGTVNKGFFIRLLNKEPILEVKMIDPPPPPPPGEPSVVAGGTEGNPFKGQVQE